MCGFFSMNFFYSNKNNTQRTQPPKHNNKKGNQHESFTISNSTASSKLISASISTEIPTARSQIRCPLLSFSKILGFQSSEEASRCRLTQAFSFWSAASQRCRRLCQKTYFRCSFHRELKFSSISSDTSPAVLPAS